MKVREFSNDIRATMDVKEKRRRRNVRGTTVSTV